MIRLVALVVLPASILHATTPRLRPFTTALFAAAPLMAIADALLRQRALAGVHVSLPRILRLTQGRADALVLQIANAGNVRKRVRFGLAIPDTVEMVEREGVLDLPSGDRAELVRLPLKANRRGSFAISACYLEAASPLGLWIVRQRRPVECELRVYPDLRRESAFRGVVQAHLGPRPVAQVGRGREFEKLREYVPGDGPDEIHWKATARRGRPITKVFQLEQTQEIYAVIDASRLSGVPIGDEIALDRTVRATLLLAAAAERYGDLFGLATVTQGVDSFLRAQRGKLHYAACRDRIFQLQPQSVTPDFDDIASSLMLRLRRRSLLLFLTSLDDPFVAESFARATRVLRERHLVMAGMLCPTGVAPLFSGSIPETTSDIYPHLADHLAWRKLKELEAELGRQGVRLALLPASAYAERLIGLYRDVKQRQLL